MTEETNQLTYDPGDGSRKLTDWSNEPTLLTLKQDFDAAKPAHDAQMTKIQHWSDLMNVRGKAKPPEVKGRSQVQPKLIRRQAEWRYAPLTEPFLSSNKLFSVKPQTFEDEAAAQQNELVLNWQFQTKINKIKFVDDLVRATVDEGTSIVRLGWKRVTKNVKQSVPKYNHFEIESEEQAQLLQQAIEMKAANPRIYEEQTDPAVKACVDLYEEQELATYAVQDGVEEIEVERIIENRPTLDVLNPNNVYIDPSCEGDLEKALFAVISFETNYSELKREGKRYKNLDKINWEGNTPLSEPDHATNTPQEYNFRDKARKKVVAYEYWGYFDIEGNGELVPFVATWIGDTVIRMELNPFPDEKLPLVVIPYLPIKRSLFGEPDAELLEDNQKIIGAVTRGMIDLLGRSANGQQGFAKGMLDPLNRRRYDNGQDYEFNPNQNPQNNLIEHKYPEIPQSAILMLNLQQSDAEGMTGVKAFGEGLGGDAYGKIATGIRGVLDAASKREMAILRRVAKGMVEIAQKIMSMNAEFLSDKEVIRVTNKSYVSVKREDLKGNFDLETDISTAEVDNQQAQDLAFMLQTMGPNMDPQMSYYVMSEIARLKRMPALSERLLTYKPQPDPMQERLKEAEVAAKEMEVKKLQSDVELNQAKIQEIGIKAKQALLDGIEQETGTKHAREMDKQAGQARGNQDLQITKALTEKMKEGEQRGDVTAGVGYNQVSDMLRGAANSGSNVFTPERPLTLNPNTFP